MLADRVELQNVKARFPSPDFTGHYRMGGKWGYVQVGGALRYIAYDDLLTTDPFDLSGHVVGLGHQLSSKLKVGANDALRLQLVYGAGLRTTSTTRRSTSAIKSNPGNTVTPVVGEALGDLRPRRSTSITTGTSDVTSSVGYSRVDITTATASRPTPTRTASTCCGNLLYTPVKNVMMGGEFQWASANNNSDGFSSDDFRIQFSFKYSFSAKVGG